MILFSGKRLELEIKNMKIKFFWGLFPTACGNKSKRDKSKRDTINLLCPPCDLPPPGAESGNVFLIITLGIVMFAALMFTVSRGTNESPSKVSDKQSSLSAANIVTYANTMERGVARLLRNGVSENSLSFETGSLSGYAHAACSDDECRVFSKVGGGITYQIPDTFWFDSTKNSENLYGEWYFPSGVCVQDVGGEDASNCESDSISNEDLIAVLPWVRKEVCENINDDAGITDIPQDAGNAWAGTDPKYQGSFSDGHRIGDSGGVLDGHTIGCFKGGNSSPNGGYHVYKVLLAR